MFPATLAAGKSLTQSPLLSWGPKSNGWSFCTRLCSPAEANGSIPGPSVPALPPSSCLEPWCEGWRCRGRLSTTRQQASGKGQENPRNTGPEQISLQTYLERPKHLCSFKFTLLRFSLTCKRTHPSPKTPTDMSPCWGAGRGVEETPTSHGLTGNIQMLFNST